MPSGNSKILLYFFLGISVFVSIAVAVIFFTVWVPMKSYISETPFPIDHVPVSKSAEDSVSRKVKHFFSGSLSDTLVINSLELNHLLRANGKLREYGVQYIVSMDSGLFNVRCSVPIEIVKNQMASLIRFLKLEGYINAEIEGRLLFKEGQVLLASTRAQLNGKPAPYGMLGKRTHIDVFDFIEDKSAYLKAVKEIKKLSIEGGEIVAVR